MTNAPAPRSVCLLRLSAIGDTCHVVPLLRSLQAAWPQTRFTWVIGKTEAKLMRLIPGVEFIEVDKRDGWRGLRALRRELRHRRFDVLLQLQHSVRASAVSLCIRADRRIGFDRARARELQWLFNNERIAARQNEHVLDSLLGFADALGVHSRAKDWTLPLPAEAVARARHLIRPHQPTLVISPCSSHPLRNWSAERYAQVADFAARQQGMRVLLCGGPSRQERQMADAILSHARTGPIDLVGQDTLPELLALLARATVLLSPDSGPVHMATLVGTPVIGLYAATRVARSGPYRSQHWCVDAYEQAARQVMGESSQQLEWTRKIEKAGVMDLITVDQVVALLNRLLVAAPLGESRMSDITVPISAGELLDKITILRIKERRIADAEKLVNVRRELRALERVWRSAVSVRAHAAEAQLTSVNETLWDIEDRIREQERRKDFGPGFIELARQVYLTNDLRAEIKRAVSVGLGSLLIEEKSYRSYTVVTYPVTARL